MSAFINFKPSRKLYLKDPDQTVLGRKIIPESIRLIDKVGFENFNFKKLSLNINSTEASIYRYFENKHKLLVYLISCYWVWLNYQIEYNTNNIYCATERLQIIIKILTEINTENNRFTQFNEAALHRIAICEARKAFRTKEVSKEDKDGMFKEFKIICEKITDIVKAINPEHPFPSALVITLIEAAHHQIFFAQYLPGITGVNGQNDDAQNVKRFLEHLVFSSISQTSNSTENHG